MMNYLIYLSADSLDSSEIACPLLEMPLDMGIAVEVVVKVVREYATVQFGKRRR